MRSSVEEVSSKELTTDTNTKLQQAQMPQEQREKWLKKGERAKKGLKREKGRKRATAQKKG